MRCYAGRQPRNKENSTEDSPYLVLGVTWCSMTPLAVSQNVRSIDRVPGRVESTAQRLTHSLEKQGYDVLRGYFKLMTNGDCDLSNQVMHSCYGNNPAAPYVIPIVPPWHDEWVDPATTGALGKTADGDNATCRLNPREALFIFAQMPPPAAEKNSVLKPKFICLKIPQK